MEAALREAALDVTQLTAELLERAYMELGQERAELLIMSTAAAAGYAPTLDWFADKTRQQRLNVLRAILLYPPVVDDGDGQTSSTWWSLAEGHAGRAAVEHGLHDMPVPYVENFAAFVQPWRRQQRLPGAPSTHKYYEAVERAMALVGSPDLKATLRQHLAADLCSGWHLHYEGDKPGATALCLDPLAVFLFLIYCDFTTTTPPRPTERLLQHVLGPATSNIDFDTYDGLDKGALTRVFGMRISWVRDERGRDWLRHHLNLREWPWCDAPSEAGGNTQLWDWQLAHDLVPSTFISLVILQHRELTDQARYFLAKARERFELDPSELLCTCFQAARQAATGDESVLVRMLGDEADRELIGMLEGHANVRDALWTVAPGRVSADNPLHAILSDPKRRWWPTEEARAHFAEYGVPLYYDQAERRDADDVHTHAKIY